MVDGWESEGEAWKGDAAEHTRISSEAWKRSLRLCPLCNEYHHESLFQIQDPDLGVMTCVFCRALLVDAGKKLRDPNP